MYSRYALRANFNAITAIRYCTSIKVRVVAVEDAKLRLAGIALQHSIKQLFVPSLIIKSIPGARWRHWPMKTRDLQIGAFLKKFI